MKINIKYFDNNLNAVLKEKLDSHQSYFKYFYLNNIIKKIYRYEVKTDGEHKILALKYFMYSGENIEEVKKECFNKSNSYEILSNKQCFDNYSLWTNKTFYKLKQINPTNTLKELINTDYLTLGYWEYNNNNNLIGGSKYVYRKNNLSKTDNYMFCFNYDSNGYVKNVDLNSELTMHFEDDEISLEKLLKFLQNTRNKANITYGLFNYDFLWDEKKWFHSLLPIIPKSELI